MNLSYFVCLFLVVTVWLLEKSSDIQISAIKKWAMKIVQPPEKALSTGITSDVAKKHNMQEKTLPKPGYGKHEQSSSFHLADLGSNKEIYFPLLGHRVI